MNIDREVVEQALTALENAPMKYDNHGGPWDEDYARIPPAADALRAALAAPEPKVEPVAWRSWNDTRQFGVWLTRIYAETYSDPDYIPDALYLHPPQDTALREENEDLRGQLALITDCVNNLDAARAKDAIELTALREENERLREVVELGRVLEEKAEACANENDALREAAQAGLDAWNTESRTKQILAMCALNKVMEMK